MNKNTIEAIERVRCAPYTQFAGYWADISLIISALESAEAAISAWRARCELAEAEIVKLNAEKEHEMTEHEEIEALHVATARAEKAEAELARARARLEEWRKAVMKALLHEEALVDMCAPKVIMGDGCSKCKVSDLCRLIREAGKEGA